jgi:RNA polymerase sigma factor (sigma-70 family)
MHDGITAPSETELFSPAERDRLVRLCAYFSGSAAAAEDLAQETLFEAWRSRDRLRDRSAQAQWMSGIARNVCRRWQHRQSRSFGSPTHTVTIEDDEVHIADDTDLDLALERSEVADLVARALSLLPAGSRDLLIEPYVEDLAVGEMAARRRISEGTAAVRLSRGKRALRTILSTDLRQEAVALGVFDRPPDDWQGTRIWCPCCGATRLFAQRDISSGTFAVRCPACGHRTIERAAAYVGQVHGFWRTLLRAHREADRYYRVGLAAGSAPCACCGRSSRLRYAIPPDVTGLDRNAPGVHIRCDGCGAISFQPDLGLALTHPIVQQFWREHKRIRLGSRQHTVSGGREAILIRFDSMVRTESVEVVAADTLEVLHAGGSGAQEVQR